MDAAAITKAVAKLDAWLDTMRRPDGYGGPVAHWWQNCLQFTGTGLDWRYEGIVIGYLNLYRKTGEQGWLARARRAGQDLVQGQLPTGNFRNSCFELNPYPGGTPHEAACDLALLHLAEALREQGDPACRKYLATAEENIRGYYIGVLWDSDATSFRDHPRIPSLVPNKAATLVEALLKLAELTGDEALIETYALPTLQAVLAHQVQGSPLDGAIYQHSQNGRMVCKFFPFYIARCVPGLVAGYEHSDDERFLDAAQRAMAFVLCWRYEDGSFPQVVYPSVRGLLCRWAKTRGCPRGANGGGRINRYPQWVAGVGDILRAMALLERYGLQADPQPTLGWMLRGQEVSGGFRTAHGFASQIAQREPGALPEFRDLLPVVGWSSMAFRYLTAVLPAGDEPSLHAGPDPDHAGPPLERECFLRGQRCQYREDETAIELRRNGALLYRWKKGASWAEVCAPELWWK